MKKMKFNNQSGNIFMALFAAVAFMGLLGVATTSYMKGPLTSSVNVSRVSMAEYQMRVASNVAIRQAAALPNGGDCDGDGMVEPIEYEDAGAGDAPIGGGYYPDALGASVTDPWGVRYGYCVWNGGAAVTGANAACDDNADATEQRLNGQPNVTMPVVALISAGKNRKFETTCSAYVDDTTDMISKNAGSDDVVLSYTYEEASSYGGGLWSIQAADSETAEIDKTIEFAGGMSMGTVASTSADDCDGPEDVNRLYFDDVEKQVVRCDGAGNWQSVLGGGSGEAGYLKQDDGTSACGPSNEGEIRYNTALNKVETCDGSAWTVNDSFDAAATLSAPPHADYNMDIAGPCNAGECPFGYSDYTTFTVRNIGSLDSEYISKDYSAYLGGTNPENFEIDWASSTCDDNVYLPAYTGSCQIDVRAKADRNMSYSANLTVTDGTNSVIVYLSGESTGLVCQNGDYIEGGYIVGNCTGVDGGPGDGQLIVQEEGCGTNTNNPTCSGNYSDDTYLAPQAVLGYATLSSIEGKVATDRIGTYLNGATGVYPAAEYCLALDLNGYTDWFLPSKDELITQIYSNSLIRAKFYGGEDSSKQLYASSSWIDTIAHDGIRKPYALKNFNDGGASTAKTGDFYSARCARRHNSGATPPPTDTNPEYYLSSEAVFGSIPEINIYTDANTQGSYDFKVTGFNQNIFLSISGDGSPTLTTSQGNGTSISLTPEATVDVTVLATAGAAGTTTDASLTSGADIIPVKIHALDPADETLIFVTENLYNGDNGGLAGVDSICQTEAQTAGISNFADYKALVSTSTIDARDRLSPFSTTIYNMNDDVIANDINELSSGEIQDVINYYADGTAYVADEVNNEYSMVRTASLSSLRKESSSLSRTCQDYTSVAGSTTLGNVNHFDHRWIRHSSSQPCAALRNYYCFGPKVDVSGWSQISSGKTHTCGITADGNAWCWGEAASGKLGNNTSTGNFSTPQAVAGGGKWKRISAGSSHTCAIKSDDSLWCWGNDNDGRLGNGSVLWEDQNIPTEVTGSSKWIDVSLGGDHSCGIKTGGTAWCWGKDTANQLGNGAGTTAQEDPVLVSGGDSWIKIASGGWSHTCGLTSGNIIKCWGEDGQENLGNGAGGNQDTPGQVSGTQGYIDVFSGEAHSCGIKSDNSLLCWGSDSDGQLGNGSSAWDSDIPALIDDGGGVSWAKLASGGPEISHSCAIKAGGAAWCWGAASSHQLGDGGTTSSKENPVQVSGTGNWDSISLGSEHSCGIKSDGTAWCWGAASNGRLGNGSTSGTVSSPVEVTDP